MAGIKADVDQLKESYLQHNEVLQEGVTKSCSLMDFFKRMQDEVYSSSVRVESLLNFANADDADDKIATDRLKVLKNNGIDWMADDNESLLKSLLKSLDPVCLTEEDISTPLFAHSPRDNYFNQSVGFRAEITVFQYLSHVCPYYFSDDEVAKHWVTANRNIAMALFGYNAFACNDSLGYDFKFNDDVVLNTLLNDNKNASDGIDRAMMVDDGAHNEKKEKGTGKESVRERMCFIKVKGFKGPRKNRFFVSQQQLNFLNDCKGNGDRFLIIFVEGCDSTSPKINGHFDW